ncbi:MAG: hypothetical protein GC165_12705 [Armatimonadetes bacterium]|nr:hypothetical protein [Armatimonadota bacterium]MBS1726056.1 hypothetical protein [Armatimonadota bacterium]
MFNFWENDLTAEETDKLLGKCAAEIRRRKLEAPAIAFLEMHKPIANVFAHAGLATAPFLVPLFGFDFINDYSNLLQKRDNVERLICMLEEPPDPETPEASESGKTTEEELCQTKYGATQAPP